MADDTKEPWLNYLALTTVIFAVCATLATFKGGGYSTRSVMSQSQASDQWAFFQAKSIKSNLVQMQKEKMELDLLAFRKDVPALTTEAYKTRIGEYTKKIAGYEREKTEIQTKAKQLEAARDDAQIHSKSFGIAVILLQISILLSSIAALLKKKIIWLAGVATGLVGIILFLDGFLLFM